MQSLSVGNLSPGAQTQMTFPGYTYPTDGILKWEIVVGNGSDIRTGDINVSPYAVVPHVQSTPMRGQWPGNGGEPGQTMRFDVNPVVIGVDCVVDTTRGGGQFTVDDINNPAIKYPIAFSPGYSFDFGGNTFWRSLSSVTAAYDEQARTVSAAVTLKGLGSHGLFGSRGAERFDGTFTVYSKCPS